MDYAEIIKIISAAAAVAAALAGIIIFLRDTLTKRARRKEALLKSFDDLVAQLSSDNRTAQLSAAILLRRYFKTTRKKGLLDLRKETINVISSYLKTIPTGVFQKTLADGLAYGVDLSKCDLQKTNLQDVLLDNKNDRVQMNETDLFLADLSYANLEGITGHGIIFYRSILFCARIRNCDFTNANFRGADLTGVAFKDCILEGADFMDALNIPPYIKDNLVDVVEDNKQKRVFNVKGEVSARHDSLGKTVFFSMPGVMSKEDELLTKDYKEVLERKGFEVIYYTSDEYPRFGQFNKVREDIMRSTGMVAFGLKQINIHTATYRPDTQDRQELSEKWFSTPWNEIEVGMGLMKGMPILLVTDPEINHGVFDEGLSECFVAHLSTKVDCRELEYVEEFKEWVGRM